MLMTWRKSAYRIGLTHRAHMHGCPLTASSMRFWTKMTIFAPTVSATTASGCLSNVTLDLNAKFELKAAKSVHRPNAPKLIHASKYASTVLSRASFSFIFQTSLTRIPPLIERVCALRNAIALFVLVFSIGIFNCNRP